MTKADLWSHILFSNISNYKGNRDSNSRSLLSCCSEEFKAVSETFKHGMVENAEKQYK